MTGEWRPAPSKVTLRHGKPRRFKAATPRSWRGSYGAAGTITQCHHLTLPLPPPPSSDRTSCSTSLTFPPLCRGPIFCQLSLNLPLLPSIRRPWILQSDTSAGFLYGKKGGGSWGIAYQDCATARHRSRSRSISHSGGLITTTITSAETMHMWI